VVEVLRIRQQIEDEHLHGFGPAYRLPADTLCGVTLAQWTAVERYFDDQLVPADPALDAVLRACDEAGLPAAGVTADQGKLLHLLARMCGARAILEIGTLGGYSAIWLARALPAGGRMVTLEAEPGHAEVARANLDRAGLASVVDVRVGRALGTLPRLVEEGAGPFDMVFIDADKEHNAEYLRWALELSRPGTVIVGDNVVRGGDVADPDTDDVGCRGVRRFVEALAADPRVTATVIQTVGSKGYDGFALAIVNQRR
jgi:predicted O-methyltransferase YrrM